MIKHCLALLPSHCVPRKHTHMQVQEGVGGIRLFLLKLSPVLNCGLKEKKKETKKTHHTTKTPVWLLRVACSPTICAPGRSCSAPTHLQRLLLPEVLHNCTEREQSTELTSGQVQNYQWGWVYACWSPIASTQCQVFTPQHVMQENPNTPPFFHSLFLPLLPIQIMIQPPEP